MSKPIDYSKWDNICYSDDSDDDENKYAKPRVTKIDKPGKVTRSSDGTITIENTNETTNETTHSQNNDKEIKNKSLLTHNGSSYVDTKTSNVILWSQDRYEVQITLPYSTTDIRAKSIKVKCNGILPFKDRCCATTNLLSKNMNGDEKYGSLCVTAKDNDNGKEILLLNGLLPHFIHSSEDDDDSDATVDWTIETNSYAKYSQDIQYYLPKILNDTNQNTHTINFIRITLYKATPMEGMYIWWDQVFLHTPKIDIDTIKDRSKKEKEGTFKDIWKDAHDLFRQKMEDK